ncbi:MAG: hypothetical protein IT182_18465 [Acidobacteria bacterium]|nr:hypothetical protein [Acidobacteriota bacterium]
MIDVKRCPDPESLLVLLYDDEGTADERAVLHTHVDRCPRCAEALTALDGTRGMLGAWHAPRLPLGFALVRQEPASPYRSMLWRGGLAAAAVLVLASAVSLAQLDISYGTDGLRIRTGVSRDEIRSAQAGVVPASAVDASAAPQAAEATPVSMTSASPAQAWVSAASAGEPPWRQDMDLLATQIRTDVSRLLAESRQAQDAVPMRAALAAAPAPAGRTMTDAQLLQRIQELIDQSEIRQQSNLALRVTELGRQFELQRQGDIVQVEQAFRKIEQQRNDLLRRVAAQQPRP